MFRIKLLILLLVSSLLTSCTKSLINQNSYKFSVSYIGGELDGLNLKNSLINYLSSFEQYNPESFLKIEAKIEHSSDLYITNIDNTSDRENITSSLFIKVFNGNNDCYIFEDKLKVSQFYIYAQGNKFLSNREAIKRIKKDNTDIMVRNFINELNEITLECNDIKKSN